MTPETNDDSTWHSYSSLKALGHIQTKHIFDHGPVLIEEKIDGSQFSFGVFGGEVRVRSRGRVFDVGEPDGLFKLACETVKEIAPKLTDGWTYRGEVVCRPKHNTLTYERIPKGGIIIFDVETTLCGFLDHVAKEAECNRIGIETVPVFYHGTITCQDQLDELKNRISCLGGTKIEGFVVKAYDQFTKDHKVLMGKWVSEQFKEIHQKNWKIQNPTKNDILDKLLEAYTTKARWQKAVQHLEEAGQLEHEPRDIPLLVKEIQSDVKKECEQEIKDILFNYFWKKLQRGVVRGAPEWYKQQLMEGLFEEGDLGNG